MPVRDVEHDRVRVAQREDDLLALHLGAVADADDVELPLEASVTPATALATRLRARPWNLPSAGSSVARFATRCAVGQLEVDAGRERLPQLALRALHFDGAVEHLDGDALGNRDRFLSDTRHVV